MLPGEESKRAAGTGLARSHLAPLATGQGQIAGQGGLLGAGAWWGLVGLRGRREAALAAQVLDVSVAMETGFPRQHAATAARLGLCGPSLVHLGPGRAKTGGAWP